MRHATNDIGLPKQFIDTHINQHQLARLLGLDEPAFFRAYLAGEIPPGVTMTEFLDVPLICWPRADIQAWLDAGRPANAELADRRQRVIVALQCAIEAEYGVSIDTLAAHMVASSN